MYLEDMSEVVLPSVLGAVLLFSLALTLRLTKILKSLYLYNDFRLEPLAVYKPTPSPTFSQCAKTFIPLWGALSYSSPQFDLPPAAHLYLAAVHLTLLWALNLTLSMFTESFTPELAITVAGVSTGIALLLTYTFHRVYLSSFNLTDIPDISQSQSVSDLQRSDLISTVQPHKRGASWASTLPPRPAAVPMTSLKLEGIVMCCTAVTIGLNCWSVGASDSKTTTAETLLFQWLLGIGVDLVVRSALCLVFAVLKVNPNLSTKYWLIDFGLTPSQIYGFKKQPIVDQCDLSDSEHIRKDTFSMEQLAIEPPPTTPAQMFADYDLQLPANADTVQWAETAIKPSPTKSFKASPDRAAHSPEPADSESSQGSADTLPEMPHNLQSPVESPSLASHFHFFRTPERPCFASPERSPVKPEIRISPVKKGFELVLRPIEGEQDWKPVDPDQEVFIVEYLPGGIMPRQELQGSQYHLEAQDCPFKGSCRSQSLPKPISEVVQRAKSVIRQPSTPRLPEVTESWMPTSRPVYSSQEVYSDFDPIAYSPREVERLRRVEAAKQSFKNKRQQVNRSVSPYKTLLSEHSGSRNASAEALQALAHIYTPHLPQTPPPLVRRGRYLKKALADD